jgi:hypothetical protein
MSKIDGPQRRSLILRVSASSAIGDAPSRMLKVAAMQFSHLRSKR